MSSHTWYIVSKLFVCIFWQFFLMLWIFFFRVWNYPILVKIRNTLKFKINLSMDCFFAFGMCEMIRKPVLNDFVVFSCWVTLYLRFESFITEVGYGITPAYPTFNTFRRAFFSQNLKVLAWTMWSVFRSDMEHLLWL